MEMRKVDVLNNLKGHVLWPQSYHLSEAEAKVCIKALEQETYDDWYDIPSDEMTLEQARHAVKDLRKMWAKMRGEE